MIEHWLIDCARKHKPIRETEAACHRKHLHQRRSCAYIAVKRSRNSLSLASTLGIDIHSPFPPANLGN